MMVSICRVSAPGVKESISDCSSISLSLPAVLGRGPLLKCAETKVSRRHGTLDWDDDGLIIEAVHKNPMYVYVNGKLTTLNCNESKVLRDGDMFGLLPHTSWYRVKLENKSKSEALAVTEENQLKEDIVCTDTSNLKKDAVNGVSRNCEHPERSSSPKVTEEPSEVTATNGAVKVHSQINPAVCHIKEATDLTGENKQECVCLTRAGVSDDAEQNEAPRKLPSTASGSQYPSKSAVSRRVRSLPAWLVKQVNETSSPDKSQENESPQVKNKLSPVKKSRTSPVKKNSASLVKKQIASKASGSRKRLHDISDDDSDEISVDENTAVDTIDKSKTNTTSHSKNDATSKSETQQRAHDISDIDDEDMAADVHNVSLSASSSGEQTSPTKPTNVLASKGDASTSSVAVKKNVASPTRSTSHPTMSPPSSSNGTASGQKVARRKSCQYGASCYRRNPQHKLDEAHPGDSDYQEDDSDGDDDDGDDRPECEYGVDCYRKNPQHRRDYKHTRLPQPQRQAKRKAKRQRTGGVAGNDSEDSYDYDDPFLNDDSSDDYAPTDSEESDSEWDPSQPMNDDEKKDLKRMKKEAKKFTRKK